MSYDQQILFVLTEAGERGISVQSIAKHVYNMNTTFFYMPSLEEIHAYVQQYLLKNSKSPQSLIENTGRRGYYRLNTQGSADARQLMLDFQEEHATARSDEDVVPTAVDLSLSLFD